MGKGPVGLGSLVKLLSFLDRLALAVEGVEDLGGKPLAKIEALLLEGGGPDPLGGEEELPLGGDGHGNLVVLAALPQRPDLHEGLDIVEARDKHLDGVLVREDPLDLHQRVAHQPLRDSPLPLAHNVPYKLGEDLPVVLLGGALNLLEDPGRVLGLGLGLHLPLLELGDDGLERVQLILWGDPAGAGGGKEGLSLVVVKK